MLFCFPEPWMNIFCSSGLSSSSSERRTSSSSLANAILPGRDLVHMVNKGSIQSIEDNLKAIQNYPQPSTYMKIQAFLGLTGHYRCFIRHYVHKVEPLNAHLSGDGASKKGEALELSEAAKATFAELKEVVLSAPVLAFTDFD